MSTNGDINVLRLDRRSVSFDPVALAGLSPSQVALMEPLAIIIASLKDGNGRRIMFEMDFWIMAQIIKGMTKGDGAIRDSKDIIDNPSPIEF